MENKGRLFFPFSMFIIGYGLRRKFDGRFWKLESIDKTNSNEVTVSWLVGKRSETLIDGKMRVVNCPVKVIALKRLGGIIFPVNCLARTLLIAVFLKVWNVLDSIWSAKVQYQFNE